MIYFYTLLFKTLACISEVERGLCYLVILVLLYLLILLAPIISPITMSISSIFFIYYCIGVAVYFINKSRLGDNAYTQKMVPEADAPPLGDYCSNYFQIEATNVKTFYL